MSKDAVDHKTDECACEGKECKTCKKIKCVEHFYKKYKDCKTCCADRWRPTKQAYDRRNAEANKARVEQWRQANLDRSKAVKQAYWQKNKDKMAAKKQEWRQANADKIKQDSIRYYQEKSDQIKQARVDYYQQNIGKVKKRVINYSKENPELRRAAEAKRRTRKTQAGGSYTVQEWSELKAKYNSACLRCGKQEPEVKLTADHVIPVIKGGSSNIENIQPLCLSCNAGKRDKIIDYRH